MLWLKLPLLGYLPHLPLPRSSYGWASCTANWPIPSWGTLLCPNIFNEKKVIYDSRHAEVLSTQNNYDTPTRSRSVWWCVAIMKKNQLCWWATSMVPRGSSNYFSRRSIFPQWKLWSAGFLQRTLCFQFQKLCMEEKSLHRPNATYHEVRSHFIT